MHQCINAIIFKFANIFSSHYLNEACEYAPQCRIESKNNFAKLKVPFWKTDMVQKGLSYIGHYGIVYPDYWCWSRVLIWESVELCQVLGQTEVPSWLSPRGKILKIVGNSGQLVSTFLSKHWWKRDKIRELFCSIDCANVF